MEFNRILVPVNGTEVDDEVIRLACRMVKSAKKEKGRIWAVYVITVRRALPLNAEIDSEIKKGEAILDHTETVAEEEDCRVETDLLQARDPGPTIVDEAVEREADLVLMGIEYKKHFGQFSLGSVAPYVLENAPCRVVLYQQSTAK
jgi:nucleotide-binding universal stress UspA family protein